MRDSASAANGLRASIIPTVLDSSPKGERAFDIFSLLLKERIVFLGQEVDDQIANLIIAELLYLDAHEPVFPGFRERAERRRVTDDLAARRAAAGLSQTEVAARMGTSQSAVARLESGSNDVRLSTLERYAEALGFEVAWKLTAKKEP